MIPPVVTGLGLWLMASPEKLGTTGAAADSSPLVGALVVTFSVIAMGEPARAVRFVNVPLGVWIVVAPWILAGAPTLALWNGVVVGVALVVVSLPRGAIRDHYGAWDRYTLYSIRFG